MSLLITLSCIALGIYIAQAVLAMIFGGWLGHKALKAQKAVAEASSAPKM